MWLNWLVNCEVLASTYLLKMGWNVQECKELTGMGSKWGNGLWIWFLMPPLGLRRLFDENGLGYVTNEFTLSKINWSSKRNIICVLLEKILALIDGWFLAPIIEDSRSKRVLMHAMNHDQRHREGISSRKKILRCKHQACSILFVLLNRMTRNKGFGFGHTGYNLIFRCMSNSLVT